MTGLIAQRKTDHLDLATHADVGFRETTTLFEQVTLVHDALPELSWDELDTSIEIFGKTLRVPLFIAAMTGGTPRARSVNERLATIAEQFGCGFGLGSQSPMLGERSELPSFAMRGVAPTALILGNIGAVRATKMTLSEVQNIVDAVGADALCVHLNPAMELVQPNGDRDFRGVLPLFERLVEGLSVPVIAKETGCGISMNVAARLARAGVKHVDVSGAGGTSWVAVEGERAAGQQRSLGARFREWGVPTAASVMACAVQAFETIIATGGVYHGLDVARALVLGASAGGVARPVLQALESGGEEAALDLLATFEVELRATMLLVGARTVGELRSTPRVVGAELERWREGMR